MTVVPVGRASRDNTASPAGSTASSSGTGTGSGTGGSGSGFGYNSSGELTDPNLTDDTYVVEAPSFIVPYVYEKPPLETFKDFKDTFFLEVYDIRLQFKRHFSPLPSSLSFLGYLSVSQSL